MRVVAIIPARYGSTRFKGKPLVTLLGKPLIQWVYEATKRCSIIDDVIVATDSEDIKSTVESFGGRACLTSCSHKTGTDRIAEVARDLRCNLVVNVQGDEPLIEPAAIEEAVSVFSQKKQFPVSTLKTDIMTQEEFLDPNIVKVVTNKDNFALYFSRSALPFWRERDNKGSVFGYKHIGLYVYERDFLLKISQLPPTPLELAERLEQLRILEYGYLIKVVYTKYQSFGVDTPEDLTKAESMLSQRMRGL